MADEAESGHPREMDSRGKAPGCPVCGTAIPEPSAYGGGGAQDGPGVTRCPGCGEEYPDRFMRDEFIHDAAARFRLEGKGELGAFGEGDTPKAVERPLAAGAVFETGGLRTGGVEKRELEPGDRTALQVAPSTELTGMGRGLPGDEVLHSRKPGPQDDGLLSARTPDRPEAPEGPPGVTARGVGRGGEEAPAPDRKIRPPPHQ